MLKKINDWREKRRQKKLAKMRALNLTPTQVLWIKILSTAVLVGIMIAGMYVSFGALVAFATMFGKLGEAAIIVALIIDALAVLGLAITLLFPSASSKTAFLGGVGASSTMNAFIGFTVGGPVGAVVAVIPQISTVLGERVVFDLLFHSELQPLQEDTTEVPVEVHQELDDELEELEVMDDYQEPEVVIVEDPVEDFWSVPNTVAELHQETPAPQETKVEVPVGFTRYSKDQVVEILVGRGEVPGRPSIIKEFGVSDWTARQIVTELKNS